ncbi:MAG: bifunctional nuclease family protein [Candidatus Omnitrophota bacterium]
MIQVELARIIIDEKNHDQAIVLREKDGSRQVPIVIGFVEATSIQMRISGMIAPRPLTHDLLAAAIQALGAGVDHVLIDDLSAGTFFAKLCLKKDDGSNVFVDCRPSDGIALAVRLNTPVFVEEKVFQQAASSDM